MKQNLSIWHESRGFDRSSFKIDKRFKRRILVLFNTYYIWESIRIIQKSQNDDIQANYFRAVGVKTYGELRTRRIKMFLYKWLNKYICKAQEIKSIKTNKKYLNKCPLIEDVFIDVKRSRVLKELGI